MGFDFYDYPELYDALLPVEAHLPFYADLARKQNGAVLELACGTGQITVPMAALGLPITGLDSSPAMLNVARQRALAAGAPVTFVQGDMRDFALERRFDLIFVARNSLLHLLSPADLLATFTAVRRHLTGDGLFAFDIFNPNPAILGRPRGQRAEVMQVETTAFGHLRVESANDYDPVSRVNRATWFISTPEKPDAWVVPLVLRSTTPEEIPPLLSAAGLTLVSRFGELSGIPFGPTSRVQVCLCRSERS